MTDQTVPGSSKLSFNYRFYWGLASLGISLISGIYGGLLTKSRLAPRLLIWSAMGGC